MLLRSASGTILLLFMLIIATYSVKKTLFDPELARIRDQQYEHEQRMVKTCMAMGGVWHKDEMIGCLKPYESCGPDDNKPGFTICEQKFKRIYPGE